MSRKLIVRSEAETDIAEAALWYEGQEAGLGEELLSEIRAAIFRAMENPKLHPQLRRQPEVRRILTKRFPYRVFYITRSNAIAVFAVLHAARHDRHWRKRI
jgi:plasmid stabilization system protein ParE